MVKFILIFIATFLLSTTTTRCVRILPILFWHSAGESCCETEFQTYSSVLRKYLGPKVTIKSVQIGETATWDRIKSLTVHPFDQIAQVCAELKNDVNFRDGYNGIGLSQGALLIRGLAQTCPHPKMRNLISLGGPHQGVFQYPRCGSISAHMCAALRHQLNLLLYARPTQNILTPATYWHDLSEQRYRRHSTFLAILNNVKELNCDYVRNLQSLEKLVLVKYQKDQAIIPNESTFFGYWDVNQRAIQLEETNLYREDRLGLKSMNENGQLIFLICPNAAHLEMNEMWFANKIIFPYLL